MSLEINLYSKRLTDELLPLLVERLNTFEMNCEIDPQFSFNKQSHNLRFKYHLLNPAVENVRGKELTCMFEMLYVVFDLAFEKRRVRQSFMDKILGKKPLANPFGSTEVENRLSGCNQMVSFVWHGRDMFELRLVSLTTAILAQLTGGISCYPADNVWYSGNDEVTKAWEEIKQFEADPRTHQFLKFQEFSGWN